MNPKIKALIKKYKGDRFFDECFKTQIYKEIYKLGHLGTVIDLGALRGEFSFYIYEHADRIFAIEPHPEAFKQLQENCKGLDKISVHNLIITNRNGTKYIRGNDDGGATAQNEGGDNSWEIPCMTLATFLKENNIRNVDALKVDIEGSEPDVFTAPDFKEVADKIDFIQGEHGSGLEATLVPYGFDWKDGFTASRKVNLRHFVNMYSKLNKKDIVACEVGVEAGNHARQICRLDIKELHLVENDPYLEQARLERLKNQPVIWHNGDSTLMAKSLPDNYFDFVYVDADHSYKSVLDDLIAWYPKVKKGGYLAGHDWAMVPVQEALAEFLKDKKVDLKYMDDDRKLHEDWYFIKP